MRRSRVLALVSLLVVVIVAAPAFAATQSITVMVPPWAEIPAAALQQFEKATGIHVNLNIVGWDQIRDKIAIAAVGGSSPADVVEVDWSWVGQLGDADWMMPLNQYVDDAMRSDIPSISIFTSGKDVIAVPYSNDLRIGLYNAAHFQKAGVAGPPQTWDAFVEAARKIKAGSGGRLTLGPCPSTESDHHELNEAY
ncbi:MAG: extracellular solute-binding protein, partial [Limnochordaceae bacterium]|nr:extracellular solute-binding protein [Limnochordaceae bacterium]